MLPHVNSDDGNLAANDGILVLGGDNPQTVGILNEPTPTTAVDAKKSPVKSSLETVDTSPRLVDGFDEAWGAVGVHIRRGGGGQVFPEERMVDVAAAVEPDSCLEGDLLGDVVGRRGSRVGLEGVVQVIDVGLVMLAVVQLHDLRRDTRLERLRFRQWPWLSRE